MPISVFGNSIQNNSNKIDNTQFVQKTYLRTNYIESDIAHDIDLKNHNRIKNIPQPNIDNDIISKIYIDDKIADKIKRNIQNDGYKSFLDNDKLQKYSPKITLTNESLFYESSGSNSTGLWFCYVQSGDVNNFLSGLSMPTPLSWRTGPGTLYQGLSYISFQSHFLTTNTYAEISRFDIHNIIKIELVINRYSEDNIIGEFSIFYKNSNDEWTEFYKIEENSNITPRNQWDTITLSISENNYGLRIRHNKKNSSNQMCSIAKITLTYTI